MPKQTVSAPKPISAYLVIAILLISVVALLYSNFQARGQNTGTQQPTVYVASEGVNSNQTYAMLEANYSAEVSRFNNLERNYTALLDKSHASNVITTQEVVNALYHNKTVHLSAPLYNPNYNRITGCYYIDGYENFSFYAPYSGYVVFNETNDGIPTNFTSAYVNMILSTEPPRYVAASPYNGSYWCSGETVQSNIAPYTVVSPFNNQTMIIPVRNGTNYFYFDNGNANQQHGVNPFPINLTFSMTYYGFRGVNYTSAPNFDVNQTVSINWGRYP